MKRLSLSLLLAACSDSVLTGNPREDLDTLTALREVDCTDEPLCGAEIHCMTDARRSGAIAELRTSQPDWTGRPGDYNQYFFTYNGGLVLISELPAQDWMSEKRCRTIVAIPTDVNGCWQWGWADCGG
jgi:hypothetical protein